MREIKADNITLHFNESDKPQLNLSLTMSRHEAIQAFKSFKEVVAKGKLLNVDIKQHRAKRSLDSNAYAWLLMNEIGNVLRTSKDEVYLSMLKRYGQSSVVSVIDKAVDTFRKSVKYCEDIGEADMGDKHFIHIKVFMGSSEFDTRQMSVFIDGIVSECKELNIETLPPAELERMKTEWDKKG